MAEEGEINDGRLLSEQVAYYRARAAEYEFWERSHQYELDPETRSVWDNEVEFVQAWVDEQHLGGHILELACGTGIWTGRLARLVDRLTAVDASPEVLRLNEARLNPADRDRIEFVRADLFRWHPAAQYDFVFFSLLAVTPTSFPHGRVLGDGTRRAERWEGDLPGQPLQSTKLAAHQA